MHKSDGKHETKPKILLKKKRTLNPLDPAQPITLRTAEYETRLACPERRRRVRWCERRTPSVSGGAVYSMLVAQLKYTNTCIKTGYFVNLFGSILFIMGKYKNIIFVYAKFSRNIFHSIRFSRALVC